MTSSALSFCCFIVLFFFLARYWSAVRLKWNVNTDWHHGLCSRGGNKVSTQCFLSSVSLLLHQETLAKSHLYFPCSWSFVIPAFFWFHIYIFSAIVYFDTGQNKIIAHDLHESNNWDLRSKSQNSWVSEESIYKLRYCMSCLLSRFLHTTGDFSLLPQLFWTAEQVSLTSSLSCHLYSQKY